MPDFLNNSLKHTSIDAIKKTESGRFVATQAAWSLYDYKTGKNQYFGNFNDCQAAIDKIISNEGD